MYIFINHRSEVLVVVIVTIGSFLKGDGFIIFTDASCKSSILLVSLKFLDFFYDSLSHKSTMQMLNEIYANG